MYCSGRDLVIAAGAAVALDSLLTGHCADYPFPVRAALRVRPARPLHRRRWDSATIAAWEVTARHTTVYGAAGTLYCGILTVLAETLAGFAA